MVEQRLVWDELSGRWSPLARLVYGRANLGTSAKMPARQRVLEEFNIKIGGGPGEFSGKVRRIGLMAAVVPSAMWTPSWPLFAS